MINVILYSITLYTKPFLTVCGVVLFIGFFLYFLSGKFDIHRKSSRYLGLLTRVR